MTKYVLSATLDHSDWQNTVFLSSLDGIKKLKASEGSDITIYGFAVHNGWPFITQAFIRPIYAATHPLYRHLWASALAVTSLSALPILHLLKRPARLLPPSIRYSNRLAPVRDNVLLFF
jgi:hypothetical protein